MSQFVDYAEVESAQGGQFSVRSTMHSKHPLMRNLVAADSLELLVKTTREHALRHQVKKGFGAVHESSAFDVTVHSEHLTPCKLAQRLKSSR